MINNTQKLELCQPNSTIQKPNETPPTCESPRNTTEKTSSLCEKSEKSDIGETKIKSNNIEELYNLYFNGFLSMSEIERKTGFPRKRVSKILQTSGFTLRSKEETQSVRFCQDGNLKEAVETCNLLNLKTDEQNSVIIGSMLGDGSITNFLEGRNSSFLKNQQVRNKEYLDWHYNFLRPFSKRVTERFDTLYPININGKIIQKKCEKYLKGYSYITIGHKIFTALENEWYKRDENGEYIYKTIGENRRGRIKTIPTSLKLTSLAIAIWHCDDGCNSAERRCVRLCTDGFTFEEVDFLVEKLKDFNIKSSVIKSSKKHPEISIGSASYLDFIHLVKPYIVWDCMRYKISLDKYKPSTVPRAVKQSGVKGVCWDKSRNKWETFLNIDGKKKRVGLYLDVNEAIAAKKRAQIQYNLI